jgi:hypothetical protein
MKQFLASLASVFTMASIGGAACNADGIAFVPVVVLVEVEGGGSTEGAEVRLLDAGGQNWEPLGATMVFRNLHRNLSKPVKTDRNSTAVVWMRVGWSESSEKESYRRGIQGRLVIGPQKHPYFDKPLSDVISDMEGEKRKSGLILVQVTLAKQAIAAGEAGAVAEQNADEPPARAPDSEQKVDGKTKPEAKGLPK